MASATPKTGLTPQGPTSSDKARLMRRPTPDSDAVASSDDEHTIQSIRAQPANATIGGRRPSTGWLQDIQPNRKYSLPSVPFASNPGPWNMASSQSASRLLPTTAPNPEADQADDTISFLLSQQIPSRKSVRSQSYSIGQADLENSPLGQFSARSRNPMRHRPSKPSLLGEGLSQLREDDADELESSNGSDGGARLPSDYWQQQAAQGLLKQASETNARQRTRAESTVSAVQIGARSLVGQAGQATSRLDDLAIDGLDDSDSFDNYVPTVTRRFSEYNPGIAHTSAHPGQLTSTQWPASINTGFDNVGNMARRHSFATYTARPPQFHPSTHSYNEEDEELSPSQEAADKEPFDASRYFSGYGPASRVLNASAVAASHPAPLGLDAPPASMSASPYTSVPAHSRPGRRLFVVTFKCQRADIYYTYDNTGLEIRPGDLVITEGDRGYDLGQVSHADVSMEEAKRLKAEAQDEHFRWLVMFSQYSLAGSRAEGMLGALARAKGFPNVNRAALTSMGGQQEQDTKPKMIKRIAQEHEIRALREKEGSEAKAKRMAAQKAIEHKLPMEILDAEWQADYNKLTFFYYAEAYVNFNPLVVDIFKQHKIRIWMSAVNPASVVNPAQQIPPPSGIGPGAILPPRSNAPPAVGPGFGQASYRQQGQQGHGNVPASQAQYDETFMSYPQGFNAFQPPQYQQSFGQYNNGQHGYNQNNPGQSYTQQSYSQQGYGRGFAGYPAAGGYPSVSSGPPPMTNYGSGAYPNVTSGPPSMNYNPGGFPHATSGPPPTNLYGSGAYYPAASGPSPLNFGATAYPNVTAGASPANFGAFYPPRSYAPSPAFNQHPGNAPGYRGGYPPVTSSTATSQPGHTFATAPPTNNYAATTAQNNNALLAAAFANLSMTMQRQDDQRKQQNQSQNRNRN